MGGRARRGGRRERASRARRQSNDDDEREWDFADVAPTDSVETRTRTFVDAPVVSLREMHAARGNRRDEGDGSGRETVRIYDYGAKAKAKARDADAKARARRADPAMLPPRRARRRTSSTGRGPCTSTREGDGG